MLDAMAAAPHHHQVLLENERVRVHDSRVAAADLSWSDFIRYDSNGTQVSDSIAVELKTPPVEQRPE